MPNKFYSKIKDIYIPIDWKYFHSSSQIGQSDPRNIERDFLHEKIKSFFEQDKKELIPQKKWTLLIIKSFLVKILFFFIKFLYFHFKNIISLFKNLKMILDLILNIELNAFSGVYLITGFRGMGKTSLIKNALNSLFDSGSISRTDHKVIEMDLSQNNINELSILKSLVWNIHDKYMDSMRRWSLLVKNILVTGSVLVMSIVATNFVYREPINILNDPLNVLSKYFILVWDCFSIGKLEELLSVVIFILALVLSYLLLYSFYNNLDKIGIVTHRSVMKRLAFLNKRVNANVLKKDTIGFQHFDFKLNFGGTDQSYESITAKEIEYELIEILRLAENAWMGVFKRRFIFIFDELDKIQPHSNHSISERKEEKNVRNNSRLDEKGSDEVRKRKEKIADILGSLKLFFNSSNAKFFFIAGSEMYDEALADNTERESFLGSIFNDVIYVPSFYSDFNNQTSDITRLTEEYVCKLLMSDDDRKKIASTNLSEERKLSKYESKGLKGYHKFLTDIEETNIEETNDKDEVEKVFFTLSNFVVYLTNRSNGSPKKLIKLIEEHIVTRTHLDQGKSELAKKGGEEVCKPILINRNGKRDSRFYLHFDELCQYKLGFTSYLFTPFIYTHSIYMTNHSDKLLVSSSFLLDHLYKFHSHGFSKSNLELTPELISFNKVPELRKFMDSMFNSITQKHIREIYSGLYDFRFKSNIADEISYLSRVLQLESAVYNFTLDESIELKKYFQSKLNDYNVEYKDYNNIDDQRHSFIIGFINSTIGDLHFYDQEYDDAIIHYDNALRTLSYLKEYDFSTMRYYISYMLKLGLVYEKIRDFNTAYVIYKKVNSKINKYLSLSDPFDREAKDFYKFYLRLIFQAIICRLTVVEKSGLHAITTSDLNRSIQEFDKIYTYKKSNELQEENLLIPGHFFNKIGHILFFKNSSSIVKEDTCELLSSDSRDKKMIDSFLKNFREKQMNDLCDKLKESNTLKLDCKIKSILSDIYANTHHGYNLLVEFEKYQNEDIKKSIYFKKFLVDLIEVGEIYHEHHKHRILKQLRDKVDSHFSDLDNLDFAHNDFCKNTEDLVNEILSKSVNKITDEIKLYYDSQLLKIFSASEPSQRLNKLQGLLIEKRYPNDALRIYVHSVNSVLRDLDYDVNHDEGLKGLLSSAYELVETSLNRSKKEYYLSKNLLLSLSNYLSKLGNTLLCFAVDYGNGKDDFSDLFQKNPIQALTENDKPSRYAIVCFWLSSRFALTANHPKGHAFELTKMLYVVKDYLSKGSINGYQFKIEEGITFMQNIKRYHIKPILVSLNKANHGSRRIGIHDHKILKEPSLDFSNPLSHLSDEDDYVKILEASTNSAETKEVILLYKEIELKVLGVESIPKCDVNGLSNINNQFNRIAELIYKARFNFKLITYLNDMTANGDENSLRKLQSKLNDQEILDGNEHIANGLNINEELKLKIKKILIFDSLYCLVEVIKTRKVFGISYIHNHSNLANAHEKLGDWCKELNVLFLTQDDKKKKTTWTKELESLLNKESLRNLDAEYHYDQAIEHYYASIKMHTENGDYGSNLENMYYSEDDFEDELVHFCCSLERTRLNNGYIYQKIVDMKEKLYSTKIHDVSSFASVAKL